MDKVETVLWCRAGCEVFYMSSDWEAFTVCLSSQRNCGEAASLLLGIVDSFYGVSLFCCFNCSL